MNFTEFYVRVLAVQGQPNLNLEQHKKLFNIISLEMRLDELSKIAPKVKDPELPRLVFARQQGLRSQLNTLTGPVTAETLFETMIEASHND